MIDPQTVSCSSELHDSCGIVFKYEGRIFRALHPRGKQIFDRLAKDAWMDRLVSAGLVRMGQSGRTLPGYEAVIEADRISPVIAPTKWSTGMLCEAGQVLCALSRELLTRRLLIWDLKHFSNMAFCSKRGPVFLDLGAIHSVEELKRNVFNMSNESLLNQIATSFYVPLWLTLGFPRRFQAAGRFVRYRRRGPEAFDLPSAILRRMSLGWMAVPGLWKGTRLIRKGRYEEFFALVTERLQAWSTMLSAQTELSPEWNQWADSAGGEQRQAVDLIEQIAGDLSDKTCFDLNPGKGYGFAAAEKTNCSTYLITPSESEGDTFFAWRQKRKKPVLPVICNIWDRSLKPAFALRASADVVFILPDIFEAARTAQVPLDFVGRVLSTLTRNAAIVGVNDSAESSFPGFVSPPPGSGSPVEFASKTIGKYFVRQEIIKSSESNQTTVFVVFHK